MTDSGTQGVSGPAPTDPPEWEKSLSREIGDLARGAEAQRASWNQRFGSEAFQNPLFVNALLAQIRGHAILGVFRAVYARDHSSESVLAPHFEERFLHSAEGFAASAPIFDPVSISPFHYLDRSLEQARAQKEAGFLVDPEPLGRILTFLSQLKDIPALSGFRMDQLNQFPSKIEDAPLEEQDEAPEPVLRELPTGYQLGKVQVVRRIGVGGFAQVYLVFHPGLHEHRAAKLFTKRDLLGELPDLMKAFYAEAQLQNKLKHPNIVRVLDVDEHEGYLVLLMEYVEGRNLRSLIEERKKAKAHLTPLEILTFTLEAAKGLGHAHAYGIMHRDIKPENILIAGDGVVKLTDFGLAKTLNDSGQRRTTRLGHLLGTPQYMAPEQVFGDTYDLRVDLYALGAVIYHMAWGQPPFMGKDAWKLLERQRDEKPVPLSELMKGFPAELDRIVMKLLEKKPENRFGTAAELISALDSCRESLSSQTPLPAGRSRRRPVSALIGAGLVIALGLAAFGASTWFGSHHLREASPGERIEQSAPVRTPGTEASPRNSQPSEEARVAAPADKVPPAPAPESSEARTSPSAPITPPPQPRAVPLRERLRTIPVSAEEALFTQKILEIFSKHRDELLDRGYDGISRELGDLRPEHSSEYAGMQLEAARDLVRMAGELVQARQKALAESKGPIRISLQGGGVAEGLVAQGDDRALTLSDPRGGQISVLFTKIAPEEFIRGKTLPAAEVAFQALSGDAARALGQALSLEKSKERVALWYPVLVRLAHLEIREQVRKTLALAEAPLAGTTPKEDLPRPARAQETLRALSEAEPDILSLYPSLELEFQASRREMEALGLLLGREYSRVLTGGSGTEAYALAGTLLLAGFQGELEKAHNELIAKTGWLNYYWELHPDEPSVKERVQFWDLLDDGGCVLRDAKGPRSLVMGKPHPRASEGVQIQFEFEPLGENRAAAEWHFNLRREGGGNSYLRFDAETLSLWTLPLKEGAVGESLASVTIPPAGDGRKLHTCVLIPAEGLHVYLDGRILASLKPTDTILPGQLSLVVRGGKLSVRSILVFKKPAK